MRSSPPKRCRSKTITVAIVLVCLLAGCNDFAQRYFGGVRKETSEGPPQPAPALSIANPPTLARPGVNEGIKPTSFTDSRQLPNSFSPQFPDAMMPVFEHPLRSLHTRALLRYATMEAYTFRLRRREVVKNTEQPEEVMFVKLRREPLSVHLQWLSENGKGRELIYVRGKYDDKMQILLPAGSIEALLGLGQRQSFSPDSPLVRSRSRHSITTIGLGSIIERYGQLVTAIEKGDTRQGTAKYLGRDIPRKEFLLPVEAVHQALPPGADPLLPKGGERWWYFDSNSGLPVLLITREGEREVEYYCHDQIQWPVRLGDDDFNPDRLWKN